MAFLGDMKGPTFKKVAVNDYDGSVVIYDSQGKRVKLLEFCCIESELLSNISPDSEDLFEAIISQYYVYGFPIRRSEIVYHESKGTMLDLPFLFVEGGQENQIAKRISGYILGYADDGRDIRLTIDGYVCPFKNYLLNSGDAGDILPQMNAAAAPLYDLYLALENAYGRPTQENHWPNIVYFEHFNSGEAPMHPLAQERIKGVLHLFLTCARHQLNKDEQPSELWYPMGGGEELENISKMRKMLMKIGFEDAFVRNASAITWMKYKIV